jgi:N-acetylmuramic acid 6-phosphate etherase
MAVQMVDVHPSNTKTAARARSIIRDLAGSRAEAYSGGYHNHHLASVWVLLTRRFLLDDELSGVIARCGGSVKLAVVVVASGWGVPLCVDALERRGGSLRAVLEDVRYETIVRVFV